jgi:hypothetical protein
MSGRCLIGSESRARPKNGPGVFHSRGRQPWEVFVRPGLDRKRIIHASQRRFVQKKGPSRGDWGLGECASGQRLRSTAAERHTAEIVPLALGERADQFVGAAKDIDAAKAKLVAFSRPDMEIASRSVRG